MNGFSPSQLKKLTAKLDRRHVHTRKIDHREIDYIEGWFAIAEANSIFGFGAWDRETTHCERVYERARGETVSCAYVARVRIRVRMGSATVVREGTGWGSGVARNPADAHERAVKSAETDATKRALATFGNRFGLGLYDRDQAGVTPREGRNVFALKSESGEALAHNLSPEGFSSGLRQLVESARDAAMLDGLNKQNAAEIARLKSLAPELKNAKGEHFADILQRLIAARMKKLGKSGSAAPSPPGENGDVTSAEPEMIEPPANTISPGPLAPSRIAIGPRIDKASLSIAIPRRLRDKEHLRYVATLPCLICKEVPSHPHHLTFAQPRGLALKVSDEFVVPLCAIHHNDVHRGGNERAWWKGHDVDPLSVAHALWIASLSNENRASINGARLDTMPLSD